MAASNKPRNDTPAPLSTQYSSAQIARLQNGDELASPQNVLSGARARIPLRVTNRMRRLDRARTHRKVIVCMIALAVLFYFSLCLVGAAGDTYYGMQAYQIMSPLQVFRALYEHAYNAIGALTYLYDVHGSEWIAENVVGYFAIPQRAGVLIITVVSAVLLSVSGMLYQNVFKNPIAAPSLLGASGGVNLGMILLITVIDVTPAFFETARYLLCYGLGGAFMAFVILAAKRLSGRKPLDVVNLILIGSILGQLVGFIVNYITLFVMGDEQYLSFYTLAQMLVVDTSVASWVSLGAAVLITFVPVYFMRYRMNALSFTESEARMWGLNYNMLRAIALICGGLMMLTAQVHIGGVGLVTLIVPFMARGLFGCEFSKQLAGCTCISTLLLLVCRDLADLLPFVGDGLAIGSIVSIVALPIVLILFTRQVRGWE